MSENNEGGSDDCQLRSYEDFLQKSAECGSLISYKPVKKSKIKATTATATNTSTTSSNDSTMTKSTTIATSDVNSNNTTTSSTSNKSSSDNNQLVLIKYKSKSDGGGAPKKREIHSLLFFVFFLFVTIITLSQIIVMHSQTAQSNFYQIKLMQEELKLMDASIDRMLKERHVLPIHVWYALKNYDNNLKKFSQLIDDFYTSSSSSAATFAFDTDNTSMFDHISSSNMTVNKSASYLDKRSIAGALIADIKNTCTTPVKSTPLNAQQILDYLESISSGTTVPSSSIDILNSLRLALLVNRTRSSSSVNTSTGGDLNEMKCAQVLIDSLYFVFAQQYSSFFTSDLFDDDKTQQRSNNLILLNRYRELVLNETILNMINEQPNATVMLVPALRNMQEFLNKYKRTAGRVFDDMHKLKLNYCDPQPPILYGSLNITEKRANQTSLKSIEDENEQVEMGGKWSPRTCRARHKVSHNFFVHVYFIFEP